MLAPLLLLPRGNGARIHLLRSESKTGGDSELGLGLGLGGENCAIICMLESGDSRFSSGSITYYLQFSK